LNIWYRNCPNIKHHEVSYGLRPNAEHDEEVTCRRNKPSREPEKPNGKGSLQAPRLASLFVKRYVTSGKVSMAPDPPNSLPPLEKGKGSEKTRAKRAYQAG
jgi:hypothetical protein